jgi:hypothetical protein
MMREGDEEAPETDPEERKDAVHDSNETTTTTGIRFEFSLLHLLFRTFGMAID